MCSPKTGSATLPDLSITIYLTVIEADLKKTDHIVKREDLILGNAIFLYKNSLTRHLNVKM